MKKVIAFLAAAAMLLTAVGCGEKDNKKNKKNKEKDSSSVSEESSKDESSKDESSNDESSSKDESSKDESSKGSKDESSKDESSKDESSKDDSSSAPDKKPSSSDIKEAKAALDIVMDAVINHKAETIFDYSDMGLLAGMRFLGEELSRDDIIRQFQEEMDEEPVDKNAVYKITNPQVCDDELEELLELFSDASNDELDDQSKTLLDVFKKTTKICSFDVEMTINGEDDSDTMYVLCIDNEWKVDMIIMSMIQYVAKSNQQSANSCANTIYKAMTTALVEFDAMGIDCNSLEGKVVTQKGISKGSTDLKTITSVKPEDIAAYAAKFYCDDMTDSIWAAKFDSSGMMKCIYYAKSADSTVIGAYPQDLAPGDIGKPVGDDLSSYCK